MSQATPAAPAAGPSGRHQRSAKNYLIDRPFQLKYASYLAGITVVLSAVLGLIIWRSSTEIIEQGQKTVDRGRQVLEQSRRVSQVVSMNIAKEYKDDPELAKTFGEEAAKDEQKLKDEQQRLERDATFLAERQRNLLIGLIAMLTLMVVAVGFAGIVVTHKVAGPIFKMKRLIRQIGEGKLVLKERLRKGDELQHFFETFEKMVNDLRARQAGEVKRVDEILEKLEASPVSQRGTREFDEDGLKLLRDLRRDMQAELEG